MESKKILVPLVILVMVLSPIYLSGESDGKDVIKADKSYFDYEDQVFVLEFYDGLTGNYTYSVNDIDNNNVCREQSFDFNNAKKIKFEPNPGVEIINTTYVVVMFNSSSSVIETIVVGKPVESLELDCDVLELSVGQTKQIHVAVYPDDAADKTLVWKSSDYDVVDVSQNGYVIAKAGGKATITVESSNGVKAECRITVVGDAAPELEKISVSGDYRTEYAYGEHLDKSGIIITATYADGTTKDVTINSTFSPEIFLESGDISIKVVYGTATTHFSVTVSGGPVNPDHGEDGGDNVSLPILVCVALAIIGAVGLFFMIRRRP